MKQDAKYIRWFKEIKIGDIPIVGGKNASLGEMYRELASQGVKVPNGFAVTAEAYWYVIESAGILGELKDVMPDLDKTNLDDLMKRGKVARDLILSAGIPNNLWVEIRAAYPMTDLARNMARTRMLRCAVRPRQKASPRAHLLVSRRLISI